MKIWGHVDKGFWPEKPRRRYADDRQKRKGARKSKKIATRQMRRQFKLDMEATCHKGFLRLYGHFTDGNCFAADFWCEYGEYEDWEQREDGSDIRIWLKPYPRNQKIFAKWRRR